VSVAFRGDGRALLTRSTLTNARTTRRVGDAWETTVGVGWKSTGRLWALPAPVEGGPGAVLLQAQVATGMELDEEGRVRVLDAQAWWKRHQRLGQRGGGAAPAAVLREWHRRQARAAEAAGEAFTAQWHLERLGEGEPASADLHARRGRAYAQCQRWDRAIADLNKALEPNSLRADLWYFRGLAHFARGDNDKALADFSQAISAETSLSRTGRPATGGAYVIWFRRGQTYYRLGQMDKAIADLSQALTMRPGHGPSQYVRGQAYARQGDLKRAAADFAAAVQRPGAPATAWTGLARARLALGDTSGYRECCAQALARYGETAGPDLAASLAWTCCLAPDATTRPEQVVRLALRAVDQGRDNSAAQRALGAALYRAGRFEPASKCFASALRLQKGPAPESWLFLDLTNQRLKRPEDAKKYQAMARAWIDRARERPPEASGDKKAVWEKLPWDERVALTHLQREAEALRNEAKGD
jgi:tetratricopeptide (TPR) repeat protein